MLALLIAAIAVGIAAFVWAMVQALRANPVRPPPEAIVVGAVTNFFDALGIGSFAPTAAWLRFRRHVPDRLIPATMLIGHTPPTFVQALIFLALLGVGIDPVLLVGCAVTLTVGTYVGVGLATRAPVRVVQAVVAGALILAAVFYALANLEMMPVGGTARSLPPGLTAAAIAASFVFGVLVSFGVGHYAPMLVMLSLMGMDPRLCFPIMAGGGALAAAGACVRYIRTAQVDLRIPLGLSLGGIPAVLVAALLVKSLPVEPLRWLVIVVVLYAAATLLWSALRNEAATAAPAKPAAGG
ncbi:MAG: sulfite exporter TauE/SafE family protein [Phenylobacterium sp.]|uniref:sulfite exporter TauE/SafE family protein n=1 Tax=Phenylobacterium sp. TaxID=1871053 RepID=UPI001A431001|nr:sulfite exporter TauE/SafE family protein [Phenylobacterium sp.]MBL8773968.1 sulfite exporter TauE/SafE family protein [Phenylobacterium sp.]